MLNGLNLDISSLGYYPNPLAPGRGRAEGDSTHLKKVIDAAVLLEVPIVGTFIGADQSKSADAEPGDLRQGLAADHHVRRASAGSRSRSRTARCSGSDTWPGGQNVAYSPTIWRRMFEIIPDDNFGLNYDPSHLIWQFIDEVRPIHEFRDRIFHVHAKDMCDRPREALPATASARPASAGRSRACPASARCAGAS